MPRRGKLDELFDLAKLEAQQQQVVRNIEELVTVINSVKPIYIKLQGAERVKEVIDGVKQLSAATSMIVDVNGRVISSYNELDATTKRVSTSTRETAKATDEGAKSAKKSEDAYTSLNRQYKEAERNAINMAIAHGKESEQAMSAARAAAELKIKLNEAKSVVVDAGTSKNAEIADKTAKSLHDQDEANKKLYVSNNEVASSSENMANSTQQVGDALTLLNKEYKEAERNAINMAIAYGKESEQALLAAKTAADLKTNLDESKTFVKDVQRQQYVESIPSTSNIDDLYKEQEAAANTQESVNALDLAQADAAMSANEWAASQGTVAKQVKVAAVETEAAITPLQEYTGSLENNVKQSLQYKVRLAEISAELKELKGSYTDAEKNTAAYKDKVAALTQEQRELKIANAEVGQTINAQIKYIQAADGSYDQLNATLGLHRNLQRQLSEEEKNSPFGVQLQKDIDVLDAKLKAMDAQSGIFVRNVGNYGNVFKGAFKVIETELEKVQGLLVNGNFKGKDLEELQRKESALLKATQDLRKEYTSATAQTKAFKEAGVQLGVVYGKDSEVVKQYGKEVGAGNQKLQEANKTMNAASGSGSKFSGALSAVFSGLRNIANIIPSMGLAGLIGLLLTPIASLGASLLTFVTSSNKAVKASEDLRNQIKETNKAIEESSSEFVKASTNVSELTVNVDLAKKGLLDKDKVVKQYNESMGKVTGQVKDLDGVEKQLVENGPAYIQMMLLKAAANYALGEAAKAAFDAEQASRKAASEFETLGTSASRASSANQGFESVEDRRARQKLIDKDNAEEKARIIKAAVEKKKSLQTIAEKFQTDAAEIAKKFKFNFFADTKTGGSDTKSQTEKFQADLKAAFELRKKYLQDQINLQKAIAETEGLNAAVRVDARKKEMAIEQQLLKEETDFQLAAVNAKQRKDEESARNEIKSKSELARALSIIAGNAATERQLILKDSADKEAAIETRAVIDVIAIRKQSQDDIKAQALKDEAELKGQQDKTAKDRFDSLTKYFTKEQEAIGFNADKRLTVLNNEYAAGKIKKKQYEEEKQKIENDALAKSIKSQIAYYKALLDLYEFDAAKKEKALKKIAELEKKLSELGVKTADNDKKKVEERAKAWKELGEEVKNTVFALLEGGVDDQKNQIQEQLDLLDKKKAKDIEVVNQTVANRADAADQIAIIEARAAAQKEALERRQRQLDEQRAKFERTKTIVGIIQNTALAVSKALPDFVLAAIVGAIGAAQLIQVLAKPIPKYADGTEDHEGGLAIVGDGGKKEYAQTPDGTIYVTPNTPTVIDLPVHTKVFKDEFALMDAMQKQHMSTASRVVGPTPNDHYQFQNMTDTLSKKLDGVTNAIKNQPRPIYEGKPNLKGWVHSHGRTDYI